MAKDIIEILDKKGLNEFKKDFIPFMKITIMIDKYYSSSNGDITKVISNYKKLVSLFNKKYKNISLKVRKTIEDFKLDIFIKEKSVRDIFTKVASKLDGLKSIGAKDFDAALVEETDKFSKEIDKLNDKLFLSYYAPGGGDSFLLEYDKKRRIIRLNYNFDYITDYNSPEFKLVAYYAVKDGFKKIKISERIALFSFTGVPKWKDSNNFFDDFKPRLGE